MAGGSSRTTTWAVLVLLVVAVSWGSSFPLTKVMLESLAPMPFLTTRFTLAAVVMLAVFLPALRRLTRQDLRRGTCLGLAYGGAQIVQTLGLETTSASVSGFITGLYVVLTPLWAAVLLRVRISPRVWLAAAIATVGLALLALNGFSLGAGEALTLVSAALYALHIVGLGAWATQSNALGLAVVQAVVTAVVCGVGAVADDPGAAFLPSGAVDWTVLIYLAVIPGAVALVAQSWAQAHLDPSRAAIIMSTEPVWAAALSIAFLDEYLTWRIAVGGVLMLAAMAIVESGALQAGKASREQTGTAPSGAPPDR